MDDIRIQCAVSSKGRIITGRILPGEDLILGIEKICLKNKVYFGTIVVAIGSLSKVSYVFVRPDKCSKIGIRYVDPVVREGAVELLSGQGMVGLTDDGQMSVHFHGLMLDTEQKILGGHFVKGGNIVLATAEVTILELKGVKLLRRYDSETEFPLFNFISNPIVKNGFTR